MINFNRSEERVKVDLVELMLGRDMLHKQAKGLNFDVVGMSQKKFMMSMVKGLIRRGGTQRGSEVREISVSLFLPSGGITNRCEEIHSWVGEIAVAYTE